MHSWKKKLIVSQLALACTLAITSQANAATNDISGQTYNTFHHYNDATYADDVYYDGYVAGTTMPLIAITTAISTRSLITLPLTA